MVKKRKTFSPDFIEKAARLLKGETLNEEELTRYKQHKLNKKIYGRLNIHVDIYHVLIINIVIGLYVLMFIRVMCGLNY